VERKKKWKRSSESATRGAVHLALQMLRIVWNIILIGPFGTLKYFNSIYDVINTS